MNHDNQKFDFEVNLVEKNAAGSAITPGYNSRDVMSPHLIGLILHECIRHVSPTYTIGLGYVTETYQDRFLNFVSILEHGGAKDYAWIAALGLGNLNPKPYRNVSNYDWSNWVYSTKQSLSLSEMTSLMDNVLHLIERSDFAKIDAIYANASISDMNIDTIATLARVPFSFKDKFAYWDSFIAKAKAEISRREADSRVLDGL